MLLGVLNPAFSAGLHLTVGRGPSGSVYTQGRSGGLQY